MLPQPFWTTKYTRVFDVLIDGMSAWAAQHTLSKKVLYVCARMDRKPAQCAGTPVFYSYDPDYLSGGNQHWGSSIAFTVPIYSCLNMYMLRLMHIAACTL